MKLYSKIGECRLLNINVILDEKDLIYSGMVEDAPIEIKNMRYYKADTGSIITYYVNSNEF